MSKHGTPSERFPDFSVLAQAAGRGGGGKLWIPLMAAFMAQVYEQRARVQSTMGRVAILPVHVIKFGVRRKVRDSAVVSSLMSRISCSGSVVW